jgi:hypothetical protein
MPIDPSISTQAGQGVTQIANPLAVAGQYQGLANAQAQNQLIQASTASTQAGTAQTNQNIAISAKLQQAKGLGEWLNLPDNMRTQNAARQLTDDNLRRGIITPQEHDVSTQTINGTTSQAQLDQIAHQGIIHLMTGTERQRQIFGNPTTTNTGGAIQGGTQNQTTGALTPAGTAIPLGLTPADLATQVEDSPDPASGQKRYITLGERLKQQGYNTGVGGAAQPAQRASGTGSATFSGPSDIPNGGRNTPLPGALLNPSQSTRPTGSVNAGEIPGQKEELNASVAHASTARDYANGYQQRIQPVEAAITALSGADTGKASETLNNLRAYTQDIAPGFLQRMLPNTLTDPAKRTAFEEANKYLTAMTLQAPGGARSDAGAAAAGAASPSVHISNAAAQQVAQAILAQHRMTQSGTLAFNQSGQPATQYDKFMNQWNTAADPRAFVADKMDPAQRASLVQGMGGVGSSAYTKYKKSFKDAIDTGVVSMTQ